MDNQCANEDSKWTINVEMLWAKSILWTLTPMSNEPEFQLSTYYFVSLKRESLRSVRLKEMAEIQADE